MPSVHHVHYVHGMQASRTGLHQATRPSTDRSISSSPCPRYLLQNLDWLHEAVGDFEDDYLLIDCPGQIELYTHIPIMPRLIQTLQQANIRPCAAYLLESQFMEDKSKFFSGVLSAMSCMINLEVPHVNLLSKMDLVKKGTGGSGKLRKEVERYLETDPMLLREEAKADTNPKFHALNEAIVQLVGVSRPIDLPHRR